MSICLVLFSIFFDILHKRKVGKDFLRFFSMGVLEIFLYYGILKLILLRTGIELASYKGASDVGIINTLKNLHHTVKNCYVDFFNYFFTSKIMINGFITIPLNILLFAFSFSLFVYECFKLRNRLDIGRLFLILLALPVACNFINISAPETRIGLLTSGGMLCVLPFVVVLFDNFKVIIAKKEISGICFLICTLAILLSYNYVLINTRDAIQLKKHTDKTLYLANRILYSLESNDHYSNNIKILVIGSPRDGNYKTSYPFSSSNTNKYVDYELIWNNYDGEYWCWQNIYSHYFGLNLNFCSYDEMKQILETEEFKSAKIYPESESIFLKNDILVVKISNGNFL